MVGRRTRPIQAGLNSTNTVPHRLELKTQDGLPSDLKLKPFMVLTHTHKKKVMKLFSLLGKGM